MEQTLPDPSAYPESQSELHGESGNGSHTMPPVQSYYVVYGALLALLVLTVVVAQFHLGAIGVVLAMLIALIKAALVLLYFMHLRYSSRLTWLFAGAGFAWLLILILIMMTDYLSRGWVEQ